MKKYLAKVTLVASITLLFSFGLNVQAAHAFGWLSPQWFNQYFGNYQPQQQKQTQTQAPKQTSPKQSPAPANTRTSSSRPTAQPGNMSSQEKQLADMINKERAKKGLKPLQLDAELSKWARTKSQDMVNKNYFAHQSPTYGNVSTMLKNGGVSFRYAGENLAKAGSVSLAHSTLMNSSIHRSNILNSNYTHVGVGIAQKGSTLYITEIFAAK